MKVFSALLPGLLAATTIALASTFLSEHYGGPTMLYALLLGMAFHFLSQEGPCGAGIAAASKTVLRVGVALLGLRLTIGQVAELGWQLPLLLCGAVVATILAGALAARLFGLSRRFGVLTGGAVAICGASAALAIASVLPDHEDAERDLSFTVIGVTALSTLAMIAYPLVAHLFALSPHDSGIFLGGTIHDVAQVVGAAYSISPLAGDTATVVKLMRVALLLPVVVMVALAIRRPGQPTETNRPAIGAARPPLLPWFLAVFAALMLLNSWHVVPHDAKAMADSLSRWCLVTAIAALGMKTSLKSLVAMGPRPVVLMVFETALLAGLVLAAIAVAG